MLLYPEGCLFQASFGHFLNNKVYNLDSSGKPLLIVNFHSFLVPSTTEFQQRSSRHISSFRLEFCHVKFQTPSFSIMKSITKVRLLILVCLATFQINIERRNTETLLTILAFIDSSRSGPPTLQHDYRPCPTCSMISSIACVIDRHDF